MFLFIVLFLSFSHPIISFSPFSFPPSSPPFSPPQKKKKKKKKKKKEHTSTSSRSLTHKETDLLHLPRNPRQPTHLVVCFLLVCVCVGAFVVWWWRGKTNFPIEIYIVGRDQFFLTKNRKGLISAENPVANIIQDSYNFNYRILCIIHFS